MRYFYGVNCQGMICLQHFQLAVIILCDDSTGCDEMDGYFAHTFYV